MSNSAKMGWRGKNKLIDEKKGGEPEETNKSK